MATKKPNIIRKIIAWLHLWLGLISGMAVFIISITGCVYVFREEVSGLIQETTPIQYLNGNKQLNGRCPLKPSQLIQIAEQRFPGKPALVVNGLNTDRPSVAVIGKGYNYWLNMDAFSGRILHITDYLHQQKDGFDFFAFVLQGHRFLWFPPTIGRQVVSISTIMYVLLLISGLVLWWPRNLKKKQLEKSFKISWKARFRRLNYDLHNVLGFYFFSIMLLLAVTGLIFIVPWVSSSVYWLTSGGQSIPPEIPPLSDTLNTGSYQVIHIDRLYEQMQKKFPKATFFFKLPINNRSASIQVNVDYPSMKPHRLDVFYFDQTSLEQLPNRGLFRNSFENASFANRVRRLNLDIHTGELYGLSTKILVFFAGLISASLPVTGFLIWYNRKWGKKRKGNR